MTKISTIKENSLKELTIAVFSFFKQNIKIISLSIAIFMILPNIIYYLSLFQKSFYLFQFFSFIFSSIGIMVFNLIIFNLYKQKNNSLIKILNSQKTLTKLKQLILTGLLTVVMLIGLSFLLVIPAVIYAIYWTFANFIVLDKDLYGKKALDYSKLLIKNQWWKITLILFLSSIPTYLLTFIISIPSSHPLIIALNAILLSFTTMVFMFKYFNLDQIHNSK